ncbi:hypothetical protein VTK26DRAFT_1089 [Humicola hyalothermophila]
MEHDSPTLGGYLAHRVSVEHAGPTSGLSHFSSNPFSADNHSGGVQEYSNRRPEHFQLQNSRPPTASEDF